MGNPGAEMLGDKFFYLTKADVPAVDLPISDIIEASHAMFRGKGQRRVEMPPKPGIRTGPDAFIPTMPAYILSIESAGMKQVSGYPENQKKRLFLLAQNYR